MVISPAKLLARLNEIAFPVDVFHVGSDNLVAIPKIDRDMCEQLLTEDAVQGIGNRSRIRFLRLSKPLSVLRTTIKQTVLPIAMDCRTSFKESLGDTRFTYSHSLKRCEAYAPHMRAATA